MGQFTYKSKDGTTVDLTPYMKFEDGAYESPSKAYPRIMRDHFPQYYKEYKEAMAVKADRLDRMQALVNRRRREIWRHGR